MATGRMGECITREIGRVNSIASTRPEGALIRL